jgi:CSLREA domain-containing protein
MKTIFSLVLIITLLAVPLHLSSAQSRADANYAPLATITVNTTADEYDTGSDCSLREAIQAANTDTAFGGCAAGSGADIIRLPAGTYTLRGAANEDLNASGDLDITSDLTINGSDSKTTIIQAGTDVTDGIDRVLHSIGNVTVEINDVTIRYGKAPDGVDSAGDSTCKGGDGGGIYTGSGSTLILNNSVVIYNRSGAGGDNCTSGISSHGAGGDGGGIFAWGHLELNNTGVRQNQTGAGGDGVMGGFGRNGGDGGGIYIYSNGVVTLTNSTVGYNHTGNGGRGGDGDPSGGDAGNGGNGGSGGGIYGRYATLNLNESLVVANNTGLGGTGGDADNGTGGNGGYGGYGAGIYSSGSTAVVFIAESTIQGNETALGGSGGSGSAADGTTRDYPGPAGGTYFSNGVDVTLIDTTIRENYGMIGGLMSSGNGTELKMDRCTISSNHSAGSAGGIYNGSGATLQLSNSTLSANQADDDGGGIYNANTATASLLHTTITGNIADQDNDGSGNGGGFYTYGAYTITNSIVAENIDMGGIYPDCYGTVVSGDYNLLGIGDNTNCTFPAQANDQVGTAAVPLDPMLDVLADNGGKTETHALQPSSPAVDKIPPAGCSLPDDQRGFSRPVDYDGDGTPQCDIGAVEIRENYLLTVDVVGTGQGGVASEPLGINCNQDGGNCTEFFDINTVVTLTADVPFPSIFSGWSGDCSGMELTCAITMDMTHSVTATVDLIPTYTLSIDLVGDGSGNVSSDPAGIDCGDSGTDCSSVFVEGSVITLTATAAADSSFTGWDGDASGSNNPILITMDSNKSVEARFTENTAESLIFLPLVIR